jgi:hypothetical protein
MVGRHHHRIVYITNAFLDLLDDRENGDQRDTCLKARREEQPECKSGVEGRPFRVREARQWLCRGTPREPGRTWNSSRR